MKKRTRDLLKLLFILLLFFNLGTIFSIIFTTIGFDLKEFNIIDSAYAETLMGITLVIVVGLIYHKKIISDLNNFKINFKNNIKKCFVYFAALLGVKLVASVVTSILIILFKLELLQSDNQNILETLIANAPIMMLISSVIIAPFTEEVIFRLGFKKVIKDPHIFIGISGLVFGLMHILPTNLNFMMIIMQSVIYVSLGIALAYIYEKNNNIFYAIIPHALNNLLGILAALLLL